MSSAEGLIIRRSCVIEAELERMEMLFATAGQADEKALDLYSRLSNTQRRLLEAVGLERKAKDAGPHFCRATSSTPHGRQRCYRCPEEPDDG